MVIRPRLHPSPDGRTPAESLTQCLASTRRSHMEVKNFEVRREVCYTNHLIGWVLPVWGMIGERTSSVRPSLRTFVSPKNNIPCRM